MNRRYNDNVWVTLGAIAFYFGMIVAAITFAVFKLWLIGSLLVSTVKAVNNACGERYGSESVLSGNWFCPSTNEAK